jgi:hypothetical protein
MMPDISPLLSKPKKKMKIQTNKKTSNDDFDIKKRDIRYRDIWIIYIICVCVVLSLDEIPSASQS